MDTSMSPVLDALLDDLGLQKISDAAAFALGNPFWIVDMNSNYMVQVSGNTNNTRLLTESRQGYVLDDTMLFVQKYRIREQSNAMDTSFTFPSIVDGFQVLTRPIRIGGVIVAYISAIDEHHPFGPEDSEKMDTIARIVSTEFSKDSFYRNNKEMQYSYFLQDLLEHHFRHEDMKKRLRTIGYETKEYFYLLTVELASIESRKLVLHTIQEQIKFILTNCIYCLYENHSVFLITTEKELTSQEPPYIRLKRFFAESSLKAAISDSFRDIVLVPRHYKKTLDSLRLGQQSMPGEVLYRYSALASYHALEILDGIISYTDFCNGAIAKLICYDQKHRKELTRTLYCYLECNCQTVPAANALALHSNTMRQRLSKILEITGCDLKNGHQCFDLMMGLKMYYAGANSHSQSNGS